MQLSYVQLNMRYLVVPSYTVSMTGLPHGAFRTLAAMCCFTSANGICYPNQETLASIRGVSQPTINNQIHKLRTLGVVIDLLPVGKKGPTRFNVDVAPSHQPAQEMLHRHWKS